MAGTTLAAGKDASRNTLVEGRSGEGGKGPRPEADTGRAEVAHDHNPKIDPDPGSNTEKDPEDWVSGDEPMTGAQASYLKTLSEVRHDPEAFDESLTKAEASRRIDALKRTGGHGRNG